MREELAVSEPAAFENVLVGVDGTPTGRDAIAFAERLRGRRGRLTLAHVVVSPVPMYQNFHATPVWKERRQMLERERDGVGVLADLTGMFASTVGSGLHQLAIDCGADLLVVGSSGRDALSGSPCPVAVAPHGYADQAREIRTVGVAYNGSVEANAALAVARRLAEAYGRVFSR